MGLPGFVLNLGLSAVAVALALGATFAIAARRDRHDTIDTVWGLGFALIAVVTFVASIGSGDPLRRVLVTALTVIWGVRLAVHIFRRNQARGEDPRYAEIVAKAGDKPGGYLVRHVYLPQGVIMWVVSLPVQAAQYLTVGVDWVDIVGVGVWLLGFGFEAVGDAQLARFSADPSNRGGILDTGLWRYTRHPNYFGDACVWWGLYLFGVHHWIGIAVIVAPIVMTLFLANGTGKPMTEKRMHGTRPGYADYVARTSGFLPLPPKRPTPAHPAGPS